MFSNFEWQNQKLLTLITADSAVNLAKYFFDNSTLKNKINEKLIASIVNTIAYKDQLYKFIEQSLILNGANKQDYVINYVFDQDNNLIEIYYYQSYVNSNLNYKYQDSYNGTWSGGEDHFAIENKFQLISWKKYANFWTQFISDYPKIAFDKSSIFSATAWSTTFNCDLTIPSASKNISDKEPIISVKGWYDYPSDYAWCCRVGNGIWGGAYWQYLASYVRLWHDDENIYFKIEGYETSYHYNEGAHLLLNLNNVILFK